MIHVKTRGLDPAVGLSPWPLKAYPAITNLQHLMSHLVYGWTTAATYSMLARR